MEKVARIYIGITGFQMSEQKETVTGMDGKPLRRIHPKRVLNTGDLLLTKWGQGHEIIGFHRDGVVIIDPLGKRGALPWDKVYQFYEPDPQNVEAWRGADNDQKQEPK